MMENVKVPHDFFQKSKREYNNWVQAFFRELVQNSVDAKAKEIEFRIKELDDCYSVECIDNGKGMTEKILKDVLLCLGGSYKDEGSIGGFGYAKTLLFFAHDFYMIHSKNNFVNGEGGSYSLTKVDDYFDGTHIQIFMSKNDNYYHFFNLELLENSLRNLLYYSHIRNVNFIINGEPVKTGNIKFSYKYPTDLGLLKFSEDTIKHETSKLFIRINGLVMFSNIVFNTKEPFIGVVELDANPIEVLTSNRDSLKGDYRNNLNQIIETLSQERSSLKSKELINITLNSHDISGHPEQQDFYYESETVSNFVSSKNDESGQHINHNNQPDFNTSQVFGDKQKIQQKINRQERNISQINESHFPLNFKIQQSENVTITPAQIKNQLNQKYASKIAHAWRNAVYLVLQSTGNFEFFNFNGYSTLFNGQHGLFFYGNRPIYIGFCFDSAKAINYSNADEIQILCNYQYIKELNKEQRLSNQKIIDLAIHEVAHIFHNDHSEAFSSTEMRIKWNFEDYYRPVSFRTISGVSII